MKALIEGGEVIEALRERVLGRVTIGDLVNPETEETVIEAGTLINEDLCDLIDQLGIDEIKVRTPLTCDTRYGLCAKCYGRDLGRGTPVNVGEAVGVIAAQSIGEPGTQLTMRTFHVGGAASRSRRSPARSRPRAPASSASASMRYVTSAKGEKIVITRSGEVLITDDNGREREKHKVPYGATRCKSATGNRSRPARAWRPRGIRIPADHRRVLGAGEIRERRRGRHRCQADRRSYRTVDAGGDRSEAWR